jgi:hypothetical protein
LVASHHQGSYETFGSVGQKKALGLRGRRSPWLGANFLEERFPDARGVLLVGFDVFFHVHLRSEGGRGRGRGRGRRESERKREIVRA